MLIRDVEIQIGGGVGGDRARVDVRVEGATITAVGQGLPRIAAEPVIPGSGGALLPGLHDHHIHLLSLAAALRSVRCGPPQVQNEAALARSLREAQRAASDGWIRGFGYHESVAGELDAARLDALRPDVPLRVQHRTGALWIVNGPGLSRLGLAGRLSDDVPSGVERDERGRATGRLYRVDGWLRERLGSATAVPDLAAVGALLARRGVSGVTDATPGNDTEELRLLAAASARGELPPRLQLMGRLSLPEPNQAGLSLGAVKQVLDESGRLDPDALAHRIREARAMGRATAVHCVTRAELVVALAAFDSAGARAGDRIEHASIAPPELTEQLARLGLGVVTQPNFIRERGDAYQRDVEAIDRPWLYRCQGLLDAGVALGGGTDAPFGDPDPWQAMQAAIDRRTAAGETLGREEALSPERALALFTTPADSPGGAPRRVAAGEAADLCLLSVPWQRARDTLDGDAVAATWSAGQITYAASDAAR